MTAFHCKQCGFCCRQPGFVYLKEHEAGKIAGFLHMDLYDLTDRYCLLLERRHLVLKKHTDETCVFLKEDHCLVYDARPEQCRDFPMHWSTQRSEDYCKGMKNA